MKKDIFKLKRCRVCKGSDLQKVLQFGPTPLANAFLDKKQLDEGEAFYPLDVEFCHGCTFLQLSHVVDPKILFSDYVYVSSTSKVFIEHFRVFAQEVHDRFNLNEKSLVIDIGSNDGILLKPFRTLQTRVLGIEPASNIAKGANKDGIKTIDKYFSIGLAKGIVEKEGKAKIVTATNVFAHINDLEEVIKGLKIILDKDGVFIMEAPYLIDFVEKNYFDLVYHEHLSYWSVFTLQTLFKRHNMEVFDVKKVDVHGGTIRVFVSRKDSLHIKTKNVDEFIKKEKATKLDDITTFLSYAKKIQVNKVKLVKLLTDLKIEGKTIAGYGAPAKGNTLLNYFGIGADILDFIVDDSPSKQGLYTPGKRIPVVPSQWLYEKKPDYLLILAWNFAPSIINMTAKYKEMGGKYIIPVPVPKVK